MHKKTSFAKRAMSLLLVAVMVLGMLPGITLPVSAIGSGSGSSGGGSSIRGPVDSWASTDQYFTRFTLVAIDTPDDDSVTTERMNGENVDLSGAKLFMQDPSSVLSKARIIGSVNVSSYDKPVTSSGIDWVDSNMIDYQKQAASASSKDDAKQKIIAYANTQSKSDFPVISWGKLCEYYQANCVTASNKYKGQIHPNVGEKAAEMKGIPSWTKGDDPDDILMLKKNDQQSDDMYTSTGAAFYAITDYIITVNGKADEIGYSDTKWDTKVSNIYLDDDKVSYRLIVENGRVFSEKGGTRMWAGTTRDCIAFSLETGNKNFGHDQGWVSTYNLGANLQGDADNFYGYKWSDAQKKFIQSENGSTFVSKGLPTYKEKGGVIWDYFYYPLLGVDANGGGGSGKLWGAAIYVPYYHAQPQGMKISKTVENGSEADKQKDFVFDVSIDVGGSEPTGATLVLTAPGGDSSDEQPLKDAVDDYMFDGTKITFKIMLRHGASINIKGLPKGASYTITEEDGGTDQAKGPNGFYTYVSDSGADDSGRKAGPSTSGKLTEGDVPSASVSFTNSPNEATTRLSVSKTVEISDGKNQGKTFDFTVQVNGATPGDYTATFSPGGEKTLTGTPSGGGVQFTFTLKDRDSVTIEGLPIGASYTVTEAPVSGFTTTKTGDSGTLTAEGATASFTNKDGDPPPPPEDKDPGERYWVFWDLNYDGGGVTSCEGGTHFLQWGHPHNSAVSEYPQRNGYIFKGWALDNADADADEALFTVADPGGPNHTFFAVWEAMTIVWDANGGTFADGKETQAYAARVWHEEIPVWENCHEATVWENDDGFALGEPQWVPTGGNKKPNRKGYTFNGWYMDKECTQPIETYEEGVYPGRTYYAGWTAEKVVVTYYDNRYGTGTIVRQDEYLYNDVIDILDGMTSTDGWEWAGWWTERENKKGINVTDWDGKVHLSEEEVAENGGKLVPHQNADLPDGSVMSDKYYWTLDIYAHWNENLTNYKLHLVYNDYQNNDGVRPSTVTFGLVDSYMNNQVIKTTKVTIDPKANEQDLTLFEGLPVEDNDASLQKRTYKVIPLSYQDARGTSYRVTAPAIDGYEADWDVQTMSDADNRTLSSYRVHLNSYLYTGGSIYPTPGIGDSDNGGSYGYEQGNYYSIITFDHSLITTGDDIKFVMRWDDDGDNDGMRPGSVKLVLYAKDSTGTVRTVREYPMHNSQTGAVDANAAICEVTDDGNTWTYIFRDYQKYDDGKAIEYTVAARNDNIDPVTYEGTTFDRYGYTTEYMVNRTNGDTIGDPHGAVFHRTVETQEIPIRIVWKDENNRDGQRPDYVALALMSYQWNDHTYCWENQEIETMVIRADDKNTMTASEWTYTFVPNKVYNDGVRRVYHLAVTSDLNAFIPEGSFLYGWEETAYGNQYPTNGDRNAAGYNEGMSTPRNPVTEVTISQNTNTVSVTGNIYWDDVNNQDNIRPRNVIMQLYAHAPHNPGSAETSDPWPVEGQAYRVTVAGDPEADNWYYTFSNLPKYVDGLSGVELVYTIKIEEVDGEPLYGTYIITDNGPEETIIRYTPSYLTEQPEEDGMTAVDGLYETSDFNKSDRPYVKLYHKTETQTVDFGINWHDSNNQDRVRPTEVNVNLWKQVGDAEPVKLFDKPLMFSAMDTGAGTAWTKKLTGLSNYENGEKVTFILDMDEDEIKRLGDIGYTVTIEGNIVHMYYKTAVGDVTAKVTWSDSNNNDGYRPDNVTAELYRNGAATGNIVNLNEGNGWTFTWTGLDVKYIDNGSYGLDVVYSVKVNVPEAYTVTYTPESVTIPQGLPLDITLSHVGDTRTVPVTVFWNDNSDKDGKRPETVTVQLLADGKVLEGKTLTLSAADFTGNTWKGSFDGLPTYTDNGTPVRYSVRVEDETATNGVYQIMTAGSTLYLSHDPVLSDLSVSPRISRL